LSDRCAYDGEYGVQTVALTEVGTEQAGKARTHKNKHL